jgi:hypothetical protein
MFLYVFIFLSSGAETYCFVLLIDSGSIYEDDIPDRNPIIIAIYNKLKFRIFILFNIESSINEIRMIINNSPPQTNLRKLKTILENSISKLEVKAFV